MKDINGKLVLVTGGASGIGRLMCLGFAEKKARVVAWDLNAEALKSLEDEGREKGLFIRCMPCDVADRETVYRQAEKLKAEFGPVDVLVNNAGIVSGLVFLETPDEKIRRTIDVNVLSLFWTCKAFLPSMVERNSGHVVTISSAAGLIGVKGLADYSASKFAAFGFDESLRMELKRRKSKVRTTVVCPFFIDTGMFLGVKTRVPFLLPILKSGYAARRIIGAVLKNKQRLIMPRFVHAVFFLRFLPVWALDLVADFFGISRAMDEFVGRP
ncbi:MAG: SDR family oxidoreductase [Treponema sp.]|jgi:all-trans-retinol dehydrogenase (NAD+)|nr:SDR family oxidoreductase [Treponema sp.]